MPPPPGISPLDRGKNEDVLDSRALERYKLLDMVLEPGDMLYIPIGFVHRTSTCVSGVPLLQHRLQSTIKHLVAVVVVEILTSLML